MLRKLLLCTLVGLVGAIGATPVAVAQDRRGRQVPMMATFEKEVPRAIAEVKEWPEIDLFRRPP
jgi:hypothetical protein